VLQVGRLVGLDDGVPAQPDTGDEVVEGEAAR
jgi:hypothetical protein